MLKVNQLLIVIALILAVVSIAMGATFIYQAIEKESWMREAIQAEKVTLGLTEDAIKNGEIVDSLEEAQIAGDTIREHRRGIATTYDELLAGGRYDASNPQHLTYAQALNMENYLYLGVLGFGVTTVIMVTGVFMILAGIVFGIVGVVLFRLTRRLSQTS